MTETSATGVATTDTVVAIKPKAPTLKATALVPAEQVRREWVGRLEPRCHH
jgi:hypothetical protein